MSARFIIQWIESRQHWMIFDTQESAYLEPGVDYHQRWQLISICQLLNSLHLGISFSLAGEIQY